MKYQLPEGLELRDGDSFTIAIDEDGDMVVKGKDYCAVLVNPVPVDDDQ